MKNVYLDSATPKNKFFHYNILGFKFRVKTYKRYTIKRFDIYTDNQGLGLNFSKRYVKLYRS
jgi:hypothetical protein